MAGKATTRRRQATSCDECRLRKRKCDGALPICGGCSKRMCECIYSSRVEAWKWQQSMIRNMRARLDAWEGANTLKMFSQDLPSSARVETTGLKRAEEGESESPATDGANHFQAPTFSAADTNQAHEPRATLPATTQTQEPDRHATRHPTNPSQYGSLLNDPTITVKAHPSARPLDVAAGKAYTDGLHQILPAHSSKAVSKSKKSCTCDQCLDSMCCDMPIRRQADALVNIYFSRHNRMFPILHQPTFKKQYEWLWGSDHGGDRDRNAECLGFCVNNSRLRLFPALLTTVFALGALWAYEDRSQGIEKAAAFFQRTWVLNLQDLLHDDAGLESIQLGLLMSFYLQGAEKFSKCWNTLGLTIRMAQNKGLHFDVAEARRRGLLSLSSSEHEHEMRTRLWYACVLLDSYENLLYLPSHVAADKGRANFCREVATSFGQASSIPGFWMNNKTPKPLEEGDADGDSSMPTSQNDFLDYYIETVKLYKLMVRAIDSTEPSAAGLKGTASRMNSIVELHDSIMEWRENLPSHLKYEDKLDEYGNVILDPNETSPRSSEPLGPVDVSKRLHCRFLHTVQLNLRPTLEMLFERQQGLQPSTKWPSSNAGLQDTMLRGMASHCVHAATRLSNFLAVQIDSQGFSCWWYNTNYLYTCGSTILLGRLCNGSTQSVSERQLIQSWGTCLKHLSQNAKFSDIAQRCHDVLHDKATRLLSPLMTRSLVDPTADFPCTVGDSTQRADLGHSNEDLRPVGASTMADNSVSRDPATSVPGQFQSSQGRGHERNFLQAMPIQDNYLPTSSEEIPDPQSFEPFMDTELHLPDLSTWPALPYLSHLEFQFGIQEQDP